MTPNWQSMIEGTVTGVAATVALGLMILARNLINNLIIRFQIVKCLKATNVGVSIFGLTSTIFNNTAKEFKIRYFALVAAEGNYKIKATAESRLSERPKKPKLTKEQKELLKAGKEVQMGTEIEYGPPLEREVQRGTVTIPPFTEQDFLLHANFIKTYKGPAFHLIIKAEYVNYTDDIVLLTIETPKKSSKFMNQQIAHYKKGSDEGSLWEGRRRFGLEPPLAAVSPIPQQAIPKKKPPKR